MPSPQMKGVPGSKSAAYIAGRAIYARGPSSQEQVFGYARFGQSHGAEAANLKRAIDIGWLKKQPDGFIGLSEKAQHYYAGTEPEPKEMGSLATPRENLHAMQPLSSKHRLNPRGLRADALDNSLAAMPSHFGKVTP
jgi:hypothetical protein